MDTMSLLKRELSAYQVCATFPAVQEARFMLQQCGLLQRSAAPAKSDAARVAAVLSGSQQFERPQAAMLQAAGGRRFGPPHPGIEPATQRPSADC